MNAVETVVFDATPLNHFARAGELAVLQALVEPYRCVSPDLVMIDDQVAYNAGRAQGLRTYRTLQLIISAVRQKLFDEVRAQGLVTRLVDEDARFPRQAREDLIGWARAAGLL